MEREKTLTLLVLDFDHKVATAVSDWLHSVGGRVVPALCKELA